MGLFQRFAAGSLAVVALLGAAWAEDQGAAPAAPAKPAAFGPLEYLVGRWDGTGVPASNKVRGWAESHTWAWRFEKGSPVDLTVAFEGDKVLSKGRLTFDAASKRYALEGTDAAGKALRFVGALDKAEKMLTLDREGATTAGALQRLTVYPNSNFIRYTLKVLEREAGAPQYKPVIEVGLTKEGESLAASATASDRPKCIITGGSSTMTVSYQGASYPICCTGCQEEFNENPQKYIKLAALKAAAEPKSKLRRPTSPAVRKDDGAFGDVEAAPATTAARPAAKSAAAGIMKDQAPAPAPAAVEAKTATAGDEGKATSLLKLGQNLEKAGKATAALGYYRRVVKEYPDSGAATTAGARVKALGGK